MASTNFLVFDEGKQNMMSDGDYSANTQRARGVTPGIAYPNLHNKLYYQVSVMAKAIADFMVAQGANASDEDVEQLTDDISNAFTNLVDNQTKDVYLPLSGGTMKGNINANGYNITATKFIGNLQGKADSATNADLATKTTQDSQGQTINTTYIKGITASNATLTLTKGNGTTSTVTVNNVSNASVANKLGTSMIGSSTKPIYLNNGTPNAVNVDLSTLAPKASPAFTGTPTSPTPSTSDNSTKLATTAFVKSLFTASKASNGWWKDGSTGMIWQWGRENDFHDITSASKSSLNFPVSFPNTCLVVLPYMLGDIAVCTCSVSSYNKSSITVTWREWNGSDIQSVKFGYIAIGY